MQSINNCVQLLVEDLDIRQQLWQLNSRPRQLKYLDSKPEVSFQTLLLSCNRPSLETQRKLALTFAYSLFQLHESPWLSSQWDKSHICFFHSVEGPDLHRPFLSTSFEQFTLNPEPPDVNRFHRNLGILKLAILLLEIHKWKSIEEFRTPADLINGMPNANTDLGVAQRLLDGLDDCSPMYRGAIQACIDVPWVPAGQRVSLEDAETWNGVFRDVIDPLETEFAHASLSFQELQIRSRR
jgi:hypothetical protein